jgi:hypothetical protein
MRMGEWRRLHNKDLHSLYLTPNKVRVINLENVDEKSMKPE